MKKKNDLKFIIVFIIVVGISLLYLFQASYAKYKKQIQGDVNSTVASWNIKVNNETINNKLLLSNYITPVIDSNQYVKEGVLAPGSTGYFDVVINAEDVDGDFSYELSGTVNNDTPLADLLITDYEQDGVKTEYTEGTTITGDIQKNSGDTSIRVYFKWNDDDTNTMNNARDTEYATNSANENAKIRITIRFIQKKSATP